jgi:hypothetical protein
MVCAPMLDPLTFGSCFQPFGCVPMGSAIQSLTNAQKLSLSPSTSVGTQVSVTDGFVVSGAGADVNYFWFKNGTNNSKPVYTTVNGGVLQWANLLDHWEWYDTTISDVNYVSYDAVAFPWLVTTWSVDVGPTPVPILTHPAIQTLTAPSTAQGGVFVSGGTQDGNGIYVYTDVDFVGYSRIGQSDTSSSSHGIEQAGGRWKIYGVDGAGGDSLYYSTSAVATPDLASNWKNAADDTAASITVTSVTQGELDAGVTVVRTGPDAGIFQRYLASDLAFTHYKGVVVTANEMACDGTHWLLPSEDASADCPAFPWQANWTARSATVTRNNVAAEANWHNA